MSFSWVAWQAFWVEAIKTRALRLLHHNAYGELFLLRVYFLAENSTVAGIHENLMQLPMPDWLRDNMQAHLREEGQHIQLFAQAIQARQATLPQKNAMDWLSQHKVKQWQHIATRFQAQFQAGALVPAYVIGECAERMAMRVLVRHCRVLGQAHPLYALFSRVLSDESRHAEQCQQVLSRLVLPHEKASLDALTQQIRQVDFSWGITSALFFYAAGVYWLLRAIIWPIKPA